MKKWVLRFRAKDKIIFDQIVSGQKTVETRANTSRYSPMKTGDFYVQLEKGVKKSDSLICKKAELLCLPHKERMKVRKLEK